MPAWAEELPLVANHLTDMKSSIMPSLTGKQHVCVEESTGRTPSKCKQPSINGLENIIRAKAETSMLPPALAVCQPSKSKTHSKDIHHKAIPSSESMFLGPGPLCKQCKLLSLRSWTSPACPSLRKNEHKAEIKNWKRAGRKYMYGFVLMKCSATLLPNWFLLCPS